MICGWLWTGYVNFFRFNEMRCIYCFGRFEITFFLFFWLMLFFIISQLVVVDVVEVNGGTEIPICHSREVCLATDVGFSLWFYMNFFSTMVLKFFYSLSLNWGSFDFFINPQQVLLFWLFFVLNYLSFLVIDNGGCILCLWDYSTTYTISLFLGILCRV